LSFFFNAAYIPCFIPPSFIVSFVRTVCISQRRCY